MKRRGRQGPPHRPPPIRATSMWRVDQIFLSRRGQRILVTCSLVNDRGDLRNLNVMSPVGDPVAAVRHAAAHVAGLGNVYSAEQARLRWTLPQLQTEQENLQRDHDLEDEFFDAFEEVRLEILDRLS